CAHANTPSEARWAAPVRWATDCHIPLSTSLQATRFDSCSRVSPESLRQRYAAPRTFFELLFDRPGRPDEPRGAVGRPPDRAYAAGAWATKDRGWTASTGPAAVSCASRTAGSPPCTC